MCFRKRLVGAFSVCVMAAFPCFAQIPLGTAFTYQGQLKLSGIPVTETCDLDFSLWDAAADGAQIGGAVALTDVAVADGLFTVELDFGDVFNGNARWLEITVTCPADTGTPTMLTPRQPLTATPYAVRALSAPWTDLTGRPAVLSGISGVSNDGGEITLLAAGHATVTTDDDANTLTISVEGGDGSGLDADLLDGKDSADFWQLGGNAGTTAGTHFLGTTDDQPLELRVNDVRVARLERVGLWMNVLVGHEANEIVAGVLGGTIAGGGTSTQPNRVTDSFGTIGGGRNNRTGDDEASDALDATVGGGVSNVASGRQSTVGGGQENIAGYEHATVAGGRENTADGARSAIGGGWLNAASESNATIAGGYDNTASYFNATVGGGTSNVASARSATVPGGEHNTAAGEFSLAAGRRAQASHAGTFVWADNLDADFISTGIRQFLLRATNGVGINLNNPAHALDVHGNIRTDGQLISTVAGAPPLSVNSNLWVQNLNADLLDGKDSTEFAPRAELNDGSTLTTPVGWSDITGKPLNIGDITEVAAGVGLTGGGTSGDVALALAVPLVLDSTQGAPIIEAINRGTGAGIVGHTDAFGGAGIIGRAQASSAKGVIGEANGSSATTNYGGFFTSSGGFGRGVYGAATNSSPTLKYGGYFEANGEGATGVYGEAAGRGIGVKGLAADLGVGQNIGGRFEGRGAEAYGVYGLASSGVGTTYGVYGEASSADGYGGFFRNTSGLALATKGNAEVDGELVVGSSAQLKSGATVTGNLSASGNVITTRVNYSTPHTHYLMVGAAAFNPNSNVDYRNSEGHGGAFLVAGSGGLVAPVQLQDGARIVGVKAFFYDDSTSDLVVNLYSQNVVASGGYGDIIDPPLDSSGVSGYGDAEVTGLSYLVTNLEEAYEVSVFCQAWDTGNLRIMGVRIAYTLSTAP